MEARLVGRVPEVVLLDRRRAAAAGGAGSAVLLTGEAGIGKTALVEEAVHRASAAGTAVLTGRAVADEGAPAFWIWLQLLADAARSGLPGLTPALLQFGSPAVRPDTGVPDTGVPDTGVPDTGLPDTGAPSASRLDAGPPNASRLDDGPPDAGPQAPAAARFRAGQATVRALRTAAARPGGLLLVLEDLHWADGPSVTLLRHLCAELADVPLLVLGTVRVGSPAVDSGSEEPGAVTELVALPSVTVLPLGPLEPAAVGAYLAQQSDQRVHGSWTTAVHRLSGGNPLYVRELARLLVQQRRLHRAAGELDLPVELRRLVGHRTAQLGPACRALLGGCAALGAEVDIPLLQAAVADRTAVGGALGELCHAAVADPTVVDRLLGEAVAAGVLIDDPWHPATVRFSHELVRQARYGELSRAERIDWHRRIADALTAAAAPAAELARHRVRAAVAPGSRRAAADACRAAALAAGRQLDYAAAVRWYGLAADLTAPGEPVERAALLLARAEAAYRAGELTEALTDCTTVVELAEALDRSQPARLDLAVEAALVMRGVAGPVVAPLNGLCERVAAMLAGEDSARHARVLAQHAFLLVGTGDHHRAGPISRTAMAMADRSGDALALVAAIHARHQVIDRLGRLDEVLALADRMGALAGPSGRPDAELWARTWRLDAQLVRGDLAAVDAETAALASLADRLGWPVARWHLLRTQAARALLTGRFAEAEHLAVQARELAARSADASAVGLFLAFMGEVITHTGQARLYTDEIREAMTAAVQVPIAAAQLGQIAVRLGDRDTATMCWQRLAPALPGLPRDGQWAYVVIMVGETAAALGELDTVAWCYERSQPYAGIHLNSTTSCHGAADRPLGRMAAALGDHDSADRHFAAAVRMEHRIGALPFLAHAQLAHAQLLAARAAPGDRRRAGDLAERAVATARRLGMPGVAAEAASLLDEVAGTTAGVAGLTGREREIAALLAGGLANRMIAERLVLSERTVETHVRNLLAKLALSNRTQVAAWALRVGLRTEPPRQH